MYCGSIPPSPSRAVNVESGAVTVSMNDSATQLVEAAILSAPQDLISAVARGEWIMLKNLPIMLCCTAPKCTYYAQQMSLLCSDYAH